MNNLLHLTSLPAHLPHWGTGDMSLAGRSAAGPSNLQLGDGLEVLDLGNCSLSFEAISPIFGLSTGTTKVEWQYLRSLSLHSNPLAITHPDYNGLLQSSPALPNLQIIDAKRVVERKRKGEVQESKVDRRRREKKEEKMKPSGTNVTSGKMRTWGWKNKADDLNPSMDSQVVPKDHEESVETGVGKRKRKRPSPSEVEDGVEAVDTEQSKRPRRKDGAKAMPLMRIERPASTRLPQQTNYRQSSRPVAGTAPTLAIPSAPKSTAPAPLFATAEPLVVTKPSKSQTSVVQIIEIAKRLAPDTVKKKKKGKVEVAPVSGGIDPREVLAKASTVESEGTGLGVGGW